VREAYERDTLLQALEEIGQDGTAIDFEALDATFGGDEVKETPEVDRPLDD
jgi:hypothetical protein